ncbi:hypothetical protein [Tsukamurella sp. 1534]|uniref:hypothetical protein n=1 Tax=Tsukamurella sp. 1534 TaxID=1151061 RepID=UPI0002FC78A3|nr:hypothetical protein [Tsukamurella sp. 1534]
MDIRGRRRLASACALLTALPVAGCGLVLQDDPGGAPPPPPEAVSVPVSTPVPTPVITPYPVVDTTRTPAVALRPTTGAGIVTRADAYGLVSSVCTLGFFARYPGGEVVAFTAGHCADLARQARPDAVPVARYMTDADSSVAFGAYIKATRSPIGQDIAIIQVQGRDVRPVAPAIGPVTGVSTADDLRAARPAICIVGARTGRSCGALASVSGSRVSWAGIAAVEGDSGGPVYARWPDGTYTAVGVVNGVQARPDGTGTGRGTGTLIAPDMTANGMTLLGTRPR